MGNPLLKKKISNKKIPLKSLQNPIYLQNITREIKYIKAEKEK
jgi:hypothetical protein